MLKFSKFLTIDTDSCPKITDQTIERVDNNLIVLKEDDLYGLASLESKTAQASIIIKPIMQSISSFKDDLAIVKINDLYGVINRLGEFVIKPEYSSIVYNESVKNFTVQKNNYGLIDISGKVLIDPIHSPINDIGPFRFGHAVISIEKVKVGQRQILYLDDINNVIAEAGDVEKESKTGLINSNGDIVVEPNYNRLMIIDDSRLIHNIKKNKWELMDYQENKLDIKKFSKDCQLDNFYGQIGLFYDRKREMSALFLASLDGNYIEGSGYADSKCSFNYDTFYIDARSSYLSALFDKNGNLIDNGINTHHIEDDGTHLYTFRSCSYSVHQVGIYNALKNYRASIPGDNIGSYSNGYMIINRNDYSMVVDHNLTLKQTYPNICKEIERKGNLIKVVIEKNEEYEIIDINGNIIIPSFRAQNCYIVDDNHIIINNHLVSLEILSYKYNLEIKADKEQNIFSFDSENDRSRFLDIASKEIENLLKEQENRIKEVKQDIKNKMLKLVLDK